MPHIIVEYSEDVITPQGARMITEELFCTVEESGLFEPKNIKVRAYPAPVYKTGRDNDGFIHVQCRIHLGRSVDQKKHLTQKIVSTLVAMEIKNLVITAEVVDMDTESYSKFSG